MAYLSLFWGSLGFGAMSNNAQGFCLASHQDLLMVVLGGPYGMLQIEPHWSHAGQVPYLLYYLCSSCHLDELLLSH